MTGPSNPSGPAEAAAGAPDAAAGEPAPLDAARAATLAALADHLVPAAHGMPSAAEVITDRRLRFVLVARPDLDAPLRAALDPALPADPAARLAALGAHAPDLHGALLLVVVGAYYTDKRVRDLLGYPGQEALKVDAWQLPPYIADGSIERVLARGPVWKDPATGRRAAAPARPVNWAAESPAAPGAATPQER